MNNFSKTIGWINHNLEETHLIIIIRINSIRINTSQHILILMIQNQSMGLNSQNKNNNYKFQIN